MINDRFLPVLTLIVTLTVVPQYVSAQVTKQLTDYITIGIGNSPLLNDYRNQIQSMTIDSARVRAGYKPQLSANAYNAYAPVIHGWGYDEAISNGTTLSDLVALNKQLVTRKNLRSRLDSIHIENQSVQIDQLVSEKDLRNRITDQYISAYGSWREYEYNQQVLHLLQQQDEILRRLTSGGVYGQTDYLSLLVTLKQQEIACRETELVFRNELSTLNELCGIRDTTWVDLTAPRLSANFPMQATSTVYYQRFVVDSLHLQNLAQRIDFQYQPRFNLFADAGYVSSLILMPVRNFGASFGMSMTLPLYDGHQRKMMHQKNRIDENTRGLYADFFKTQYAQHTADLQRQLAAVEKLITINHDQLKFVDGLIDANRRLLQTGDIPITNYILAVNNYLSAHRSITQNEIRRYRILNEINYWK